MIASARLKAALAAVSSIVVATGLTAGLAWGFVAKPADDSPPKAVTKDVKEPKLDVKPSRKVARGVVVDEAGAPMAAAEVRVGAYTNFEDRGVTGQDGTFAVPVAVGGVDGRSLLVRTTDGRKVGVFTYSDNLTRTQAEAPIRIVVKPGREVAVHVVGANKIAIPGVDADKVPIPGAAVEVVAGWAIVDHQTTGADGVARLTVPVDAEVKWITAQKGGAGFDFDEFGQIDEVDTHGNSPGRARVIDADGRPVRGIPVVADLPDSVSLTLDDPRTVRIKAVDEDGKPAPGVDFTILSLNKEGRRTRVNYPSRLHQATTDADGIATFDWLPKSRNELTLFFPASEGYANRHVLVEADQTEIPVAHLARTETIRGRVMLPDGSPASDVLVQAYGTGQGMNHGSGTARTTADGSYTMNVSPNEVYAVSVDDEDRAARARLDVVVRRGRPVEGVDFQLGPGTLLKGKLTIGSNERPAVGYYIRVDESGEKAPDDLHEEGDRVWRQVHRKFGATTDDQGRYQIRVGPGTYTLMGPPRTGNKKITVTNEFELVHDFRLPRSEKGPLSGKVVRQSDGSAVAGASVDLASATETNTTFTVKADAEGRFQTERSLDKTLLWARNADGSLGAIVEIGPETPEVVIPLAPTATATGVLLDEKREIAANQPLYWGRRIYLDEGEGSFTYVFAPKIVTDAQGRFTLPSLVVGQKYEIAIWEDTLHPAAWIARPEKPGPLDLGTLRVEAYRARAEMSSFRSDAPDAGAPAPPVDATTLDGKPLSLKDFAGKYVLLDFWATWCGPCLAEIPQLQAVHDAFGKDDRFAILSLSVDETIDEPRKFQENRKLPWSQGFLSGSLHGPKPGAFGVRAIPAFVLVGPDGKIVARGMREADIMKAVEKALGKPK